MQIEVLKSKIHRATVTSADLNYIGSILDTYAIPGERGSGAICLNGAAARKVYVGDVVIIMAYAHIDAEEARTFKPKVVFPEPVTNKL